MSSYNIATLYNIYFLLDNKSTYRRLVRYTVQRCDTCKS